MIDDAANLPFEFIRPLWLFGLLGLPLLGWAFERFRTASGWEDYIDVEKLRFLGIVTPAARSWTRPVLAAALALACLSLAGPSWRTIPLPVKQPRDAMVIAFDLSPSMLATDLNPDRLTRARLKIIDLLRLRREGETALVAYADDAYRVSPLTDDASTIEALVPSLHPSVMPAPGSQVEAAAAMARELFAGAAIERGVLLIVTDGIDPSAMDALEAELDDSVQLCILAVGDVEGAPIPVQGGGFARDAKNQTILAGLNRDEVQALANRHGGCYADLRSDDGDLEQIMDRIGPRVGDELDASEAIFDVRHDEGYWLVLFLLPIGALGFRRNVLWMSLILFPLSSTAPTIGHAVEWTDLWLRADQRQARDIEQGIERYRAGDYAAAAEDFDGDSALQQYNRGNALALAGQLEEALESYDRVLDGVPGDEAAKHNREVIEKLLEEQENQSESESGDSGEQGDEENDSQDESESSSSDDQNPSEDSGDPGESQDSDDSSASDDPEAEQSPDDAQSDAQPDAQPDDAPSASDESSSGEETKADDPESPASAQAEELEEIEEEADPADSTESTAPEQPPLSDQSEQWLRNIPDDPGGLMRRKFEYQANQRRQRGSPQPSTTRY